MQAIGCGVRLVADLLCCTPSQPAQPSQLELPCRPFLPAPPCCAFLPLTISPQPLSLSLHPVGRRYVIVRDIPDIAEKSLGELGSIRQACTSCSREPPQPQPLRYAAWATPAGPGPTAGKSAVPLAHATTSLIGFYSCCLPASLLQRGIQCSAGSGRAKPGAVAAQLRGGWQDVLW